MPATPNTVTLIALDKTISGMEGNAANETFERKKQPKVINVLTETVSDSTIQKWTLDLSLYLTLGKLPASTSTVEKLLTKTISEDKAVQNMHLKLRF